MAEYHACESRNAYPGEIVLSELGIIIRTCQENIDINYQESDFHNYQLLDILRGRKLNQYNGFRQLNSDKNSKIMVVIMPLMKETMVPLCGVIITERPTTLTIGSFRLRSN